MTTEELKIRIHTHLSELKEFQKEQLPKIIGVEAVNHYTESFAKEGFEDNELKKWPDVKRRNSQSEWYGFSYRANSAKPGVGKDRNMSKKDKKGLTNFSPEATKNKVLTGTTSELKNSIHFTVKPDRVTVGTDKPYAAVHQFGLQAKVFGKAEFTMKARPFIGKSEILNNAIKAKCEKELKRILKL